MNEFKVISFMLSRRGEVIGASDDALMKSLGLEGESGREKLYRLLDAYSRNVEMFGLKVERNALDGHWFLSCTGDVVENARVNPFQGRTRLASTLVAIIIATTTDEEPATVERVKKLRNVKDVTQDLKELENMGLIKVNGNAITMTERIGYYVDLGGFIKRFNEYLNEKFK
nr:hypothetical protein [Candidatus Sigynarchaeota archaeon]